MCLLLVLRGFHRDHPIVVGGNRDERKDRKSAPPGLFVGKRHRMLSPRDRRAGGTWLAIDELGRFAGITNIAGVPVVPESPSRGLLPHLALDEPDLDAAVAVVRERVAAAPHSGFQLVLCDGLRTIVVRHRGDEFAVIEWTDPVLLVTNEHGPGELSPRGLAAAVSPQRDAARQLDALVPLLSDAGGGGHHAICKHGDVYGTVSSSRVAVPRVPAGLIWHYAAGAPDVTPYKSYGNLAHRLIEPVD